MEVDILTNRVSPYDYQSDKTQYQSQCVYCGVLFRGNRNKTVCYHCHIEAKIQNLQTLIDEQRANETALVKALTAKKAVIREAVKMLKRYETN